MVTISTENQSAKLRKLLAYEVGGHAAEDQKQYELPA